MSPQTDAPVAPDHDVEQDRDPSGPRIRCPLCGWSPRKEDKWFCTCGNEWNTFDTGGVCPACLPQWTETQCLSVAAGHRIRSGMRLREKLGDSQVKVVIFGATGMVGQGVLRECLLDPDVESVVAIVRKTSLPQHDKVSEIVHQDVSDLAAIEDRLSGYDACFFCLGVSSVGMKKETYRHVTFDLTVSVATTLAKISPTMTFIYVSGAGTDSTERGRLMWARVKGRTENALLQMRFKAVFLFRPGYVQLLHGIRTKTRWYGAAYALMRPLYPLLKSLFPNYVTTTECVGRAMLSVTKRGFPKPVLENRDINRMCAQES